MAFGLIMFISMIRFILKGWVEEFYISPRFHFTFYGFDWVKPLGETGMYLLFGLLLITSLFIILGYYYRISIVLFFLAFTYVELIDKTYYLNHYYFISIISFLMMLVPANCYFSLDLLRKPSLKLMNIPAWSIEIFKVQLLIVYFFAGISKLNADWLLEAMPLKMWLPAKDHLPVIGFLLKEKWVAYLFSWFGCIFDLSIGFLLWNSSSRKIAYLFVIVFHIFTGWFFKIGMFPYVMIALTTVFFSEGFHLKFIEKISRLFNRIKVSPQTETTFSTPLPIHRAKAVHLLLFLFFAFQIVLPFRYLIYPGKLYWTEEGYRFSWRVMLMEKGGTAYFYVTDKAGRKTDVLNSEYLTPMQEKMMVTQPDMILQYAYLLKEEYSKKGITDARVTADIYVTLNGSGSRPFINNQVDLTKEKESFLSKDWVLPFDQNNNKQ
jgi:hypothetical protein